MFFNRFQQFFMGFAFMGATITLLNAAFPQLAGDAIESLQKKVLETSIKVGWVASFIWFIVRYIPLSPLIFLMIFTILYLWFIRLRWVNENSMEPFDKYAVILELGDINNHSEDGYVIVDKESDGWTFVENESDWELM